MGVRIYAWPAVTYECTLVLGLLNLHPRNVLCASLQVSAF